MLTGYAGQLSLGQAFFVGIGAFVTQWVGGIHGLPMIVWLPVAGIAAGIAGAAVAPFALRLRGPYLMIVSLALVYIGIYMWRATCRRSAAATRAPSSRPGRPGPSTSRTSRGAAGLRPRAGALHPDLGTLGLVILVVANVMRTRGGRAMQAVRDHDVAAEVLGVRMMRTQTNAFVLASALAGVAGGLLAVNLQYIRPDSFNVELSVEYLAIIVIGGLASLWGPVLGLLFHRARSGPGHPARDGSPVHLEAGRQGGTIFSSRAQRLRETHHRFLLFRRGGSCSLQHPAAPCRRDNHRILD